MTPFPTSRLTLAAMALLAGCHAAPPQSRADAATTAACRAEVDRVYTAQNRGDISQRDQRDTPFAESYLSGITSRGLGALFSRDNQVSSCMSNSGVSSAGAASAEVGTGPTFSPAAR